MLGLKAYDNENVLFYCFRMSTPYPVDPSKASGANAGWTMPNAPGSYPAQPGYPTQPGYAAQPGYAQPGYPTQPGYNAQPAYPVQPVQPSAAFPVEPPPPYSTQQGFGAPPGPYVSNDAHVSQFSQEHDKRMLNNSLLLL